MSKEERKIFAATTEELRNEKFRDDVKEQVLDAKIGQREWPTVIQDAFLHADRHRIGLYFANGEPFPIPLVDDVWNDNERYIREFLASERCLYPARDRLIVLYFQIMMPDVARHFGR